MEKCLERIPLLKGEGAAKRRVRGEEKHLFTPHPGPPVLDAHPLPSGEGRANTGLNYFKSAETRSLSGVSPARNFANNVFLNSGMCAVADRAYKDLLNALCGKFLGVRTEYGRPAIFRLVGELDFIAFQDGGVI